MNLYYFTKGGTLAVLTVGILMTLIFFTLPGAVAFAVYGIGWLISGHGFTLAIGEIKLNATLIFAVAVSFMIFGLIMYFLKKVKHIPRWVYPVVYAFVAPLGYNNLDDTRIHDNGVCRE